jgi:hypothetical protein
MAPDGTTSKMARSHWSFAFRLRHMEIKHGLSHDAFVNQPMSTLRNILLNRCLHNLIASRDGSLGLLISSYKRPPFYRTCSNKLAILIRAHIRLGRTVLAASMYRRNLTHSPHCEHCPEKFENASHVLFDCPRHQFARTLALLQLKNYFGTDHAHQIFNLPVITGEIRLPKAHSHLVTSIFDELLVNIHRARRFF